jgi:hypothetical protein
MLKRGSARCGLQSASAATDGVAAALPVAGCASGGSAVCAAGAALGASPAATAAAADAGAAADWLAAALLFSRVLIVCVTREVCTAIPFGCEGIPISRHKVLQAAIGNCWTAVAE